MSQSPINKSLMTMNKNYNKIIKGVHAYRPEQVTFSNGKKNEVHLYPRSYVNLVNRYLNLGKNKKNKINVYKINRARIVNLGGRSASNINTLLGNRYIMHRFWRGWLNSSFGQKSRIYQNLMMNERMSKSKLSQFMEKMRNPYKSTFNKNKGTYVQATPGQLTASKTMARIREGRNKELARKWLNITRIRKRYSQPPFPVKGNNKWPAY